MSGISNKYVIFGIIILVIVIFTIFYSKPYQWSETYKLEKEDPYNVSLLKSVLEKSVSDKNFIEVNKSDTTYPFLPPDTARRRSNFISFSNEIFVDSTDMELMLDWVKQGHNAYLISQKFDPNLLSIFFEEDKTLENIDWNSSYLFLTNQEYTGIVSDTVCSYYFNPQFAYEFDTIVTKKRYEDKIVRKTWHYLQNKITDHPNFELEKLGYQNNNQINFVKISIGEGAFYLHSSPIAFSNYNFMKEDFYRYAKEVFGTLGEGDIYWDRYLMNNHYTPGKPERKSNGDSSPPEEGPLTFILSDPSLRWAWYFVVISMILYLIFGVRRKQKPIAVWKENKNTSIEYAETIGGLYFQKKDHRILVRVKMRQFKSFIKESYNVRIRNEEGDELEKIKKKIATVSNVNISEVDRIFNSYKELFRANKVNSAALVKFHDQLEDFYKKCK